MKLIVSAIILLLILFHGEIVAREQHIYLSRHAEKIKGISDPGLTEKGKNRAQWLSDFLKSKSVEVIYSTNYKRTLQTAQPVASVQKKDIIIYDPHHQEQLPKTAQVNIFLPLVAKPVAKIQIQHLLHGKPFPCHRAKHNNDQCCP